MIEKEKTKLQPYRVKLKCGECGSEMKAEKKKTMHPPVFTHKCVECGEKETAKKGYPTIEFEEIQNDN